MTPEEINAPPAGHELDLSYQIGKYEVRAMADNRWHLYLDGLPTGRSYRRLTDARRAIKTKEQGRDADGDGGRREGMRERDKEFTETFYAGVICALLSLVNNDQESLACEILKGCDDKAVRRIAKREGDDGIVRLVDRYRQDRRWKERNQPKTGDINFTQRRPLTKRHERIHSKPFSS